ncbi:hypothetical protein F53441_11102 [Fusarium austroafricanum]|uniref:Uncharacterized protein n=1 Tax=Fusarium austroafricanum TaxID=2364996 RepID=A0A8H4NN33_9HYPO|nr:hypothetical protein F53441_11102 [Fusarium austroafricanum]
MFRSQLGRCNAMLSGSFALNFFQMCNKEVTGLDIFVSEGSNADQFTDYLERSEGYGSDTEAETMIRSGVYSRTSQPNIKIRITRTPGSPIQTILTSSSTTAYINVIAWNKAYSIFPRQTLIKHKFFPLRSPDDDFGTELSELSLQGWTARDIIWPDHDKEKLHDVVGIRRIGDKSSLIIPLDTESLVTQSVPDHVIELSQFEIPESSRNNQFGPLASQSSAPMSTFLQIRAKNLSSPVLRYAYTTADTGWRGFVVERLQRWAWLELYKVKREDRPLQDQWSRPLVSDVSITPDSELPQSWDYADDQMMAWYQLWERLNTKRTTAGG